MSSYNVPNLFQAGLVYQRVVHQLTLLKIISKGELITLYFIFVVTLVLIVAYLWITTSKYIGDETIHVHSISICFYLILIFYLILSCMILEVSLVVGVS